MQVDLQHLFDVVTHLIQLPVESLEVGALGRIIQNEQSIGPTIEARELYRGSLWLEKIVGSSSAMTVMKAGPLHPLVKCEERRPW